MAVEEIKVSEMTFLDTVPDDAKIYVVKPGETTPFYTTKAALLAGISGSNQNIQQVLIEGSYAEFTGDSGETLGYEFNGEVVRKAFRVWSFLGNEDLSSDSVNFIYGLDRASVDYLRLTAGQEEGVSFEMGITNEGSSEGNTGIGNEGEYTNILITQSSNQDNTETAKYNLQFPTPVKSVDKPEVIVRFPQISESGIYDLATNANLADKADLVDGVIPSSQLPATVDEILEFANLGAFPATGISNFYYFALDTNKTYRWSGSTYVPINEGIALGETSSTAYRGDRGKIAYDHSQLSGTNPHGTTATQVGAYSTSQVDGFLGNKQDKPKLISANYTALNNEKLIVNDTCTITDVASPSNGTNYEVTIVNGSVTIGGVVYGTGVVVNRIYNSGAWTTQMRGMVVLTDTSNTSTIVGFSTYNFKIIKEYDFGNGFVEVEYVIDGTSNSATTSFTLLNNNISHQQKEVNVSVRNNGIISNTNGCYVINNNSNVVSFFQNNTETAFTASNQKVVRGKLIYYKG